MVSSLDEKILRGIFPTLQGKSFEKINLTDFVLNAYAKKKRAKNWASNVFCEYRRKYNRITYGGWLEDTEQYYTRDGTNYLCIENKFIHLGIDVQTPYMTPVFTPISGRVVEIFHDKDTDGGWGTRMTIKPKQAQAPYIIYAHLMRQTCVDEGDIVRGGMSIGFIGRRPYNGGSVPHIHFQAVEKEFYEGIKDKTNPAELDGYARKGTQGLAKKFPEPLETIGNLTEN